MNLSKKIKLYSAIVASTLGVGAMSEMQAQNMYGKETTIGKINVPNSGKFNYLQIDIDGDGDLDLLTTHENNETNMIDINTTENLSERYNSVPETKSINKYYDRNEYIGSIEKPPTDDYQLQFLDLHHDGDFDIRISYIDKTTNQLIIKQYINNSERDNKSTTKPKTTLNDVIQYIISN